MVKARVEEPIRPVKVEVGKFNYQIVAELLTDLVITMFAVALAIADSAEWVSAPDWFTVPVLLACTAYTLTDVFAWFHKRRIRKDIMENAYKDAKTGELRRGVVD